MSRNFIIDEEAFPDLPQLMLAVLQALKAMGGSARLDELDEKVIEIEGVTEGEQAITMKRDRRPKLNYYLAWSRTYLKRGNAIQNSSRGVWSITDKGETVTAVEETREIYDQVNKEERERARKKRAQEKAANVAQSDQAELDIGDEDDANSKVSGDWKSNLLDAIAEVTPDAFERLSQRLLREAGFTKVEVRGQSGDGGIDGAGVLRVNLVSFQIYFQCKRWKGSVGAREIRDFRGALQGRADKGLFITTGTFTSQAFEEATRDGAIAIDLIDGDRLCDLLKENELGVATEMVERVTVNVDWLQSV